MDTAARLMDQADGSATRENRGRSQSTSGLKRWIIRDDPTPARYSDVAGLTSRRPSQRGPITSSTFAVQCLSAWGVEARWPIGAWSSAHTTTLPQLALFILVSIG
jgi:hypothetical protein